MSARTIVIAGGGLGGLTAASRLRRLVAAEERVIVVDKKATFSLCMANLWLMTGERQDRAEGERPLEALSGKGIEFVQAEVRAIDLASKSVETSAGRLVADYLVVALGAERHPEVLSGFAEAAINLYDAAGAEAIRRALAEFRGGRVVVLVSRTPYSCPSAPYEAAFLIDDVLRKRGIRERSDVAVYSPEEAPMPVAGPVVGAELVAMLAARGISFHPEQIALEIQPGKRKILFEIDETSYDLLVGVPVHRAPDAVRACGLTDASGWVPVDRDSLETRYRGVYAIGDLVAIPLANGMYLPKAGVFADAQAGVVAERIAADIAGEVARARFDGRGFCYIDVGDELAAYGAGNFYGIPGPQIALQRPTGRFWKEKRDVERTALTPWE